MSKSSGVDTFPALQNLSNSHEAAVQDLHEGFRTYKDLFLWLQELTAVSFGYIPSRILQGAFTDPVLRAGLMTDEGFSMTTTNLDGLSVEESRSIRMKVEEQTLNPVFDRAYKDLRTNANEYLDPNAHPDPAGEDAPLAMRPSLQGIHDHQREVLLDLLRGFEDTTEILRWERKLTAATHGEVPKKLLNTAYAREPTLRDNLLKGDQKYSAEQPVRIRLSVAAGLLLPAFNEGVRAITGAAGEMTDGEEDTGEYNSSIGV